MVMFRPFDVNLAVMILSETGSHSMRLFAASFERSSPTPCVCAHLLLSHSQSTSFSRASCNLPKGVPSAFTDPNDAQLVSSHFFGELCQFSCLVQCPDIPASNSNFLLEL